MPPVFKALASIVAWGGFIGGWFGVVSTLVFGILGGKLFVVGVEPPIEFYISMALWIGTLVLSVVCMKLRQMME